jgi:hypothetical protein
MSKAEIIKMLRNRALTTCDPMYQMGLFYAIDLVALHLDDPVIKITTTNDPDEEEMFND